MGNVVPIDRVEVIQKVKENLIKEYPLSAMELAQEVKEKLPNSIRNEVWRVISENEIKTNPDYSVYNFRNKKQEDEYKETSVVPSGTPNIYNHEAVDFIVNILRAEKK